MRILIYGGTTEGRVLAEELARRGHVVTVSVATPLGAEELEGIACSVWQGRMEASEMAARVRGFDLVIDATHPYAEVVSENIRQACVETGIPLRRVVREAGAESLDETTTRDDADGAESCADDADAASGYADVATETEHVMHDGVICVESCKAAAEYLRDRDGRVLVATGSKALRDYACIAPERLYPRVLPTHEALTICEEMGIPHRNILALQGPFTREMNTAMLRQYDIAWLVTKDGGKAGGYAEKWQAAQETGARLILVGRPADSGVSMAQLLAELEEAR